MLLLPALAFAATPTQTATFNLTWEDNSSNEDGFKIYRCSGAGCVPTVQVGQVGANVTKHQDAIANDPGGVSYTYGVSAFNSAGESSKATATALSPVIVVIPGAPSGVVATVVGVKIE